ncbi:RtcB family protein [Clostridium botulinum]|nr:RtcB family protein [Clostridium botulinum]
MNGMWTLCVPQYTLDESPMVYKPIEEIMKNIIDTVDIIDVIKSIKNVKYLHIVADMFPLYSNRFYFKTCYCRGEYFYVSKIYFTIFLFYVKNIVKF